MSTAEKYSRFTDAKSGVNPFTSPPRRGSLPACSRALGLLLLLLRLPLLLVCGAVLYLSSLLVALSPPALADVLRRGLESPASRATLFALGFFTLPVVHLPKQALRLAPSPGAGAAPPGDADILLANWCSPLDVLVLSAVYGVACTETSVRGGLIPTSLWRAVGLACTGVTRQLPVERVEQVLGAPRGCCRRAPLLLQPEGAPTNGTALLTFLPVAGEVGSAVAGGVGGRGGAPAVVRFVGVRYGGGRAPTFLAVGGGNGWGTRSASRPARRAVPPWCACRPRTTPNPATRGRGGWRRGGPR